MSDTMFMNGNRFELVHFDTDGRMTQVYVLAWPKGKMCATATWDPELRQYKVTTTRESWDFAVPTYNPTLLGALEVVKGWSKRAAKR